MHIFLAKKHLQTLSFVGAFLLEIGCVFIGNYISIKYEM